MQRVWTFATVMLASAVLAACAAPAGKPGSGGRTAGQMLALTACPHRIASAEAWINLMPGPRRGPRDIHVQISLADPNDTAVLLKAANARPGELALEIRTAPASAMPGQLTWREPAGETLPKRVSILCRGGEIHAIDSIQPVY